MNTSTTTKIQGGKIMKNLSILFTATLLTIAGCKSTYYSGAYSDDDVYTPASQAYQTNPDNYTPAQNNQSNNQQQDDYYDPNGYTNNSNTQQYTDSTTGNTYITNNNYYNDQFVYDDYYDYSYAARIRRFQNPSYGFGYYNNYYTNSYYYNYDPYFYGTSIYSSYNFWGPSITFNYGWGNYPLGFGGWGSPYYGFNCFNNWYGYNNWYGNNWGYNNGYWNGYNNGFWNGYNNGYWNGYNNGYWNGYNNGYYNNYYNTFDNSSNFYYGHRSVNQSGSGYAGKTSFKEQYLSSVSQGTVTGSKLNVANYSKESNKPNIDGYNIGKENITKVKDPVNNPITKEIKPGNTTIGKEQQTQGTKELDKNPGLQQNGADRFTKENNVNGTTQQSKELPKQTEYARPEINADKYSRPQTATQQQQGSYIRPESSRIVPNQTQQQARPEQYVAPQRTKPEQEYYQRNNGNQQNQQYNRNNGYQQNKQPERNYDYNQYNQRQNNNSKPQYEQQKPNNNRGNDNRPQQNERQNFNQNNNSNNRSFDNGSSNKGGGNFNSGGSNSKSGSGSNSGRGPR